jgi:tetratricopeptide (TPR) repeat protein
MAKYKCKSLGVCEKATAAEIFDRTAGDDLKCPSCSSPLVPLDTPAGGGSRSKTPLIAGAVAALALLGGGGYYLTAGRTKAPETPPLVQESPASAAAVAVAASVPVLAPASAPVVAAPTAASGIAPSEAETKALRKDSQDKLTAGDAASAEQAGNKAAANEMLKLAIAKMSQGKLEDAEKELLAARERDPKQSLVSYNLAVLRLKQGRKDDALKEFEASFMAGFNYFNQMDQDTDLDILRKDPRFNDLIAQYRKPGK